MLTLLPPGCLQSGRVGKPAQLFGIGVPGSMPGTFRVPGSAGGQPLTDLDPQQSQPEQLFAFDKQAGVRHLGAALLLFTQLPPLG